jgi:Heterokaryon incompatibility protein (HET)
VQQSLDESDGGILPYAALSYVWGKHSTARTIIVNSATLFVTPNLFAALKQFRNPTETVNLWIDALCINQDDIQERNAQVSLMGEIYRRARVVLMWLGEEGEDSAIAMELLRQLKLNDRDETTPYSPEYTNHCREFLYNRCYEPHWKALVMLLQRPYWTRVWIVQEILLSTNPIMCCGSHQSSWLLLVGFLSAFKLSTLPSHAWSLSMLFRGAELQISLAMAYFKILTDDNSSIFGGLLTHPAMAILDGLLLCRNCQATDPQDHFYGIMGLLSGVKIPFTANYTLSLLSVYRDVVKICVDKGNNLNILSACKRLNDDSNFKEHMSFLRYPHEVEMIFNKLMASFHQFVEAVEGYSPRING